MKKLIAALTLAVVVIGCTTTKVVEDPPGSGNFKKVVEVDARLTEGLEAGKAINDASSPWNSWSGLVAIVLGSTTAVATWVAKKRGDKLNKK